MSNEILEKVIQTSDVSGGGGGLLTKDQANRFIDYMWDQTVIAQDARTVRMNSNTLDIDKVSVGAKLLRVATEATDDGVNASATFTKVSLTTTKFRLDWELSTESLEDNIEGTDLEDHIARLLATQTGNDIEDLLINGDTALTGDALYKGFDGFKKKALAGGHVVDAAGAGITKAIFNSALKAMPRVYKQRRQQLRFYTGSNLIQDYLYSFVNTVGVSASTTPDEIASGILQGNPAGPAGNAGGMYPLAFGIPIVEVPTYVETQTGSYSGASGNHGNVELTFPNNRVVGVKREIVVYRQFKPKKDTTEYTVFTRIGCQVENLDSYVVVKNVKISA